MNTEYVNFYDYYIMSEEEPITDAEKNKKIIKHLEDGTTSDEVLDTYTLQDIFYVDGKFVYSPDITLPDYHGPYYKGKHPLIILKKEFLPNDTNDTNDTTIPLYRSTWTNTMLSGYNDVIKKRIDKMINLIQHLLQDEPNTRDESNREFIQRFVEKRTDYKEEQYEEDKAQFKEDMEKTFEELKKQDNAKGYIRDIEGLLTGIYDPEPVSEPEPEPVSEPAESKSKPVSTPVSKPVSTPLYSRLWNSTLKRIMNKTKKSVSKSKKSKSKKSKKNTGKRRKRNQLQTVRRGPKRGPKKLFMKNTRQINPYKNN